MSNHTFFTRPHFEDRQQVQYSGESITLSGFTKAASTGAFVVLPTVLDFTGTTTGQSTTTITNLTGYLNEGRVSGLQVYPPILKLSGTTGTTTVDVTGYVLKSLDANGTVVWGTVASLSADTNTYVTTATIDCGTNVLQLTRNDAVNVTVDLSCLTFTGNTSGDCITDLYVSNVYGCSPITVHDNIQNVTSSASSVYSFTNVLGTNNISSSDKTLIGGGNTNTINTNSDYSSIVGGRNHSIGGYSSFIGGGRGNIINGGGKYNTVLNGSTNKIYVDSVSYHNTVWGKRNSLTGNSISYNNIIGGYENNVHTSGALDPIGSSILGGSYNNIYGPDKAIIGGGQNNTIDSVSNTAGIIGGQNNEILGESPNSFIGGGGYNVIQPSQYSAIVGGALNNIGKVYGGPVGSAVKRSVIVGGFYNAISASTTNREDSSIIGGSNNLINTSNSSGIFSSKDSTILDSPFSVIVGGGSNDIKSSNATPSGYSSLLGGSQNSIDDYGWSFIGGGKNNDIFSTAAGSGINIVVGGYNNNITGAGYATIVGGKNNTIDSNFAFIGGGYNNNVDRASNYSLVVGGTNNNIYLPSSSSLIVGGNSNSLTSNNNSSIVGGRGNTVGSGNYNFVGGGVGNTVNSASSTVTGAVLVGGGGNTIYTNDPLLYNVIVGGKDNTLSANYSFIGGGNTNKVYSIYSSLVGGINNTITTVSNFSVIGGGKSNYAEGNYSLIGGGYNNNITGRGYHNTIINGYNNNISVDTNSHYNTIIGDSNSITGTSVISNSIIGGRLNKIFTNTGVGSGDPILSFIGGGIQNTVIGVDRSAIIAGQGNYIGNSESHNAGIFTGRLNSITGDCINATIIGGESNNIFDSSRSIITAGQENTIIGGSRHSIGGRNNTINTVSSIESTIVGGYGNTIYKSSRAMIGSGRGNVISNNFGFNIYTNYTSILNGRDNTITGDSVYSTIVGGKNNTISYTSSYASTGSRYSSVIGGENNTVNHRNTHIIGSNITSSEDDMTYVEGLTVTGDHSIFSENERLANDFSSLQSLFKGQIISYDVVTTSGIAVSNQNPSGNTGIVMGNLVNYPSDRYLGGLLYFGTAHTRTASNPTGPEFYRNKIILTGDQDVDGMIIKPKVDDPSATLWFEMDGSSVMVLKGDGGSEGYLGLALNPDGTEMPSANLQIGSSGTSGTFKFVDGNQQSGYVLTSDTDGNATWQVAPSGGGGSFTGNTSGDCITDLWVSNIHSCSPLNINPLDEGNVYFGSTSAVTVDLVNNRLGIGDSSPLGKLHVQGDGTGNTVNTTFQDSLGNNLLVIRDSGQVLINQSNKAIGGVGPLFAIRGSVDDSLFIVDTITDYIGIGKNPLDGSGISAKLHIKTDSSSGTTDAIIVENSSGEDMFHLQDDGLLGIGTSTPTATLHVDGSVLIDGNLEVNGTTISSSWVGGGTLPGIANDVSTSGTSAIRLVAASGLPFTGSTITGFADGFDGKDLVLTNNSLFNITLKHQDSGSVSSNRLLLGNAGVDIILAPNDCAVFKYDSAATAGPRWRLISNT